MLEKVEVFLEKYVGAHWTLALGMGMVVTVKVQSSSITTSMLVPMAGAGVLPLAQAFPITLGANIGTTITALLASLAAGADPTLQTAGVAIALVHLLFNVSGILIWYPLAPLRRLPLWLAQGLAARSVRNRWFAFAYVAGTFFIAPGIFILLYKLLA